MVIPGAGSGVGADREDAERIETQISQGVLRIRLPKARPAQARRIRVQGG